MRYKIIDCGKVEDEHSFPLYYVTISCKYGTFTDSVRQCKEDVVYDDEGAPVLNSMHSYYLAEHKCLIQAHRKKVNMLNQRAMGIKTALDAIKESFEQRYSNYIEYDHDYNTDIFFTGQKEMLDQLEHQYNVAIQQYEEAKKICQSYKDGLNLFVNQLVEETKSFVDILASRRALASKEED